MKILALDQSTRLTGWSVFEDGKLVGYGHLDSKIKENKPIARMRAMSDLIEELVVEYNPNHIVIENVQSQRNYNTYQQLSQMQGVLFRLFFKLNIPFDIVAPVTWKSFCGIKGKKRDEQKANTVALVHKKFDIEPTEDEADSIGIGLWAVNHIKE